MLDPEQGRILVVHGDDARRDSLRHRVEEAGYTVLTAPDSLEMLDVVTAEEPDLVILNVSGARLDPTEVLHAMRSKRTAVQTIPVIVLAPQGGTEIVGRCLEAGAEDFLYEPCSPTLLRTQIREYLRLSARRRQEQRRFER